MKLSSLWAVKKVTEQALRQKVADTAQKAIGTIQGSVKHRDLIDIYNGHRPLPRGYKMSYTDPWCAATVSAVAIQCGLTDIMPVECSCGAMVKLYQQLGRWVEDDKYRPGVGDVLFYYWQDKANYASYDQTNSPNHVGIVVEVDGDAFTVVEGNRKISGVSQAAYRTMQVNGRYIRGYGIPDYASKAEQPSTKPWYEDAMNWAKEKGIMDGTRPTYSATRAELAVALKRLYELK